MHIFMSNLTEFPEIRIIADNQQRHFNLNQPDMMNKQIILASSSIYRKELLEKLHLPFSCINPDIDEQIHSKETPQNAVIRLATEKAIMAAKISGNQSVITIGSDQIAIIKEHILNKPLTHEKAIQQLQLCSGEIVTFLTGLCVYNKTTNSTQTCAEVFKVHFRELSQQDIENYLLIDKPYHCAGSFKAEGLGIALFEKMEGDDPNSLIGLPLIKLISFLKNEGINILKKAEY
jgi:septum formation protein